MSKRTKHSNADLSDYVEQPHLKRHWNETEIEFTQEALDEAERDFALGMNLQDALNGKDTPIRHLISAAARAACEAHYALIECDLFSDEGIKRARQLQNDANRFRSMISWINETLAEAGDAAELMHDYQEAAGDLPPEPGPMAGPGDEVD